MLPFHCTQNPNCATEDRQPTGEVITGSQLVQVSGSNIAAMGGSVVRGFHFFMVALQNGTVLQVSRRVRASCRLLYIHNLYSIVVVYSSI